jgi:hypothetical protein
MDSASSLVVIDYRLCHPRLLASAAALTTLLVATSASGSGCPEYNWSTEDIEVTVEPPTPCLDISMEGAYSGCDKANIVVGNACGEPATLVDPAVGCDGYGKCTIADGSSVTIWVNVNDYQSSTPQVIVVSLGGELITATVEYTAVDHAADQGCSMGGGGSTTAGWIASLLAMGLVRRRQMSKPDRLTHRGR